VVSEVITDYQSNCKHWFKKRTREDQHDKCKKNDIESARPGSTGKLLHLLLINQAMIISSSNQLNTVSMLCTLKPLYVILYRLCPEYS